MGSDDLSRRRFMQGMCLGALGLAGCGSQLADARRSEKRPNVLFFALDDLCDWVGPLGHGQAVTPNMDLLAKKGVTFVNAHTAGIFCAPSRSAIFTGRYAFNSGCYSTQVYFHNRPELQPLQVTFQKGGYQTFGGGKLFHHPAGFVDLRGWDEFFVRSEYQKKNGWDLNSWNVDSPILPKPYPNSAFNSDRKPANKFFLEWGKVLNEDEEKMADTIRTEWACDVLRRKHDKPFFAAVGLYTPHFPNYCPAKYFDLYDRDKIKTPAYKADDLDDLPPAIRKAKTARGAIHRRLVEIGAVKDAIHGYLACVSYADAMLGRLMKALEDGSNGDNTIVVLWSDHGYHHGEKMDWGKHTLWQRTSGVPFIWAGPGIERGASVDATVSLIDMYPTLVAGCGLPVVEDLDGVSLLETLSDPSEAIDRNVLLPGMVPGAYAIINRNWRYIHYQDDTEELYNLREDPNEWYNLAGDIKYKKVKAKLRAAGPVTFAEPGKARNRLSLVVEGENFHWEPKR
jgi:arylsulfatase A-like enzyme